MRRHARLDYPNKGELLKKNFDTETIDTIGLLFRYKDAPEKYEKTPFVGGFNATDSGKRIETLSDLDFARGDVVRLNGSDYKIISVELVPYYELGGLRGINRYKKLIELT